MAAALLEGGGCGEGSVTVGADVADVDVGCWERCQCVFPKRAKHEMVGERRGKRRLS